MSRYLASFYHLLISFGIFVCLAYLVVFVWYPDFFYTIDGGWEGMRIIIAVDLVLGPLLTLVVFKAGKPGLKFDLACIGTVQALCLAAGVFIVYSERPTFFVYYENQFYCANDDAFERYGVSPPDPGEHGATTPVMVFASVPTDPIEKADFLVDRHKQRLPIWVDERSYEPLENHMETVMASGFDYDLLRRFDDSNQIEPWLEEHGGELEEYAFFPVRSRYTSSFVAIRKADQEFVDIISIIAPLSV